MFNHHNNNVNHMWDFWHISLKYKLHMEKKAPWRWPTLKTETCRCINWHIKLLCNKLVSNFTCADTVGIYKRCNDVVRSTWYDTERKESHQKYHKFARALQVAILKHEINFHLPYFAALFSTAYCFPSGCFRPQNVPRPNKFGKRWSLPYYQNYLFL
jgi:hypothetical protein